MNKITYALLGMAAVVFVGCADLDYNEASNRDEDGPTTVPSMVSRLLYTMSTHKCQVNSRTIPTVMAP